MHVQLALLVLVGFTLVPLALTCVFFFVLVLVRCALVLFTFMLMRLEGPAFAHRQ
jgi:hypothetical protein